MDAHKSLRHTKWECKYYVILALARRDAFEISNSRYALIGAIEKTTIITPVQPFLADVLPPKWTTKEPAPAREVPVLPAVAGRSRTVLRVCGVEVWANCRRRAPQVWSARRNNCKEYAYS